MGKIRIRNFAGVAVAASVFTITAMSIDRYLAIRSPIAFRRVFNRKSTVFVIIALWVVALIIFAPLLRVVSIILEMFLQKHSFYVTFANKKKKKRRNQSFFSYSSSLNIIVSSSTNERKLRRSTNVCLLPFFFSSRHPFRIQVSWYLETYPFTGRISHRISPPICISTCAWKISNQWVSKRRFSAPCASCWFTLFPVRACD